MYNQQIKSYIPIPRVRLQRVYEKCNEVNLIVLQFPDNSLASLLKELSYNEFESACKQSTPCIEIDPVGSLERLKCIRECISPSCYQEIYRINDLEEGEIDVRLQSFKGCFVQRSNRSRG